MQRARQAEIERTDLWKTACPLHGLPLAIKDLYETQGIRKPRQ
jgi:Asp-tRNA(Asn)/Glu-tRNA(Gln) amidotransferase A subunit family amidase